MTTSYELSLRLKELGVEQNGGEYYYYEIIVGKIERLHYQSKLAQEYDPLCRAFTLGELVRMLGDDFNLLTWIEKDKWVIALMAFDDFYTTPEEAAGELLAAIKEQELKQKQS